MPAVPSPVASSVRARGGIDGDRLLAGHLARLDVMRRLAEHRSPLGVAEGRLLWLLSDGRARTLREIGEALQLEQSTVNRQVNGALAAKLVRRIAEPGRSARLIEPTESGRKALDSAMGAALGACRDGLDSLGEKDAEVFLGLLERFVGAYAEALEVDLPA